MRIYWFIAGILAILVIGGIGHAQDKQPVLEGNESLSQMESGEPEEVRIVRRFDGDDVGLKKPLIVAINSPADFEAQGISDIPSSEVNFESQTLILLALGERLTSGFDAQIVSVHRKGSEIWVSGFARRPGVDEMVAQVLTYPYSAVLIDKVDKPELHTAIESRTGG